MNECFGINGTTSVQWSSVMVLRVLQWCTCDYCDIHVSTGTMLSTCRPLCALILTVLPLCNGVKEVTSWCKWCHIHASRLIVLFPCFSVKLGYLSALV